MTWFAFRNGHPDISAAGLEEKVLVLDGFHGYATKAEADAAPNEVNAAQEAALVSWDAAHAARVGGGAAGGSPADQRDFLANIPNPLAGIAGFFRALTDVTLYRSLGWVVLGAVLMLTGLWLWLRHAGIAPAAVPVPVPVPL